MKWLAVLTLCISAVKCELSVSASDDSGIISSCIDTEVSRIVITCHITSLTQGIAWLKDGELQTRCSTVHDKCLPQTSANNTRYTFASDISKLEYYFHVATFDATDQGNYTCIQGATDSVAYIAAVCAPVASVTLKQNNNDVDPQQLEVTAGAPTILTCIPSPVPSVPTPTILWYVDSKPRQNSTSTSFSFTPSNDDHDKIFYCEAYNTQPVDVKTSVTPKLYVRVKVTYVTLKEGNRVLKPGDIVTVIAGTQAPTLTCIPGHARPTPTIDWYIGTDPRSSSNNTFTFTPRNADHDKDIYCRARSFNGQYVDSARPKLSVNVEVKSVTLKEGTRILVTGQNLNVTQGYSTTLTCMPGTSRPTPTINWFIDNQEQTHSGTSFTFDVNNNLHGKEIHCTAYNTQTKNQAIQSEHPNLYVLVKALIPSLLNGTTNTVTVLNGDTQFLVCKSTPTRPAAIVTWKIGTNNFSATSTSEVSENGGLVSVISTLSYLGSKADNNVDIICASKIPSQNDLPDTRKTIEVFWGPSTPSVEPLTGFPWLEGQTGTLRCVSSDNGNPPATISWSSNAGSTNTQNQLVIGQINYEHDEQLVKCQLTNQFTTVKGEVVVAQIYLDVQYKPILTIKVDDNTVDSLTIIEGKDKDVICSAIGNPQPTVTWPGTSGLSSGSSLEFRDIDRSQAENYTCQARATSYFVTVQTFPVTVEYPPDVTVGVSGNRTENESLVLTCLPRGIPNQYYYHDWTQVWAGTEIISNAMLQPGITIIIPSLQLQDSGNYTCSVDNTIPDRRNILYQYASTEILVKVSPKFFMREEPLFAGKFSENITVSIPFYTYPMYTSYTLMMSNDTTVMNSRKHMLTLEETIIETNFYDQSVELNGYRVNFTILDLQENDFADYHLNVVNDINPEEFVFTVISESIPRQPSEFHMVRLEDNTAHFVWTRGFNGGQKQTFLLQLANKGLNSWSNATVVDESNEYSNLGNKTYRANITDLKPGSYNVQLVAVNGIGQAEPLPLSTTIDISETGDTGASTFPVRAAVGGGIGAAVLVIVVVVVFILWKRRSMSKKDDYNRSIPSPKRKPKGQDNADIAEVNVNPVYESADEVQAPPVNDIFAQVNKPSSSKNPEPGPSGDVYSQVQKPKKTDTVQITAVPLPQDLYSTPVKKGKEPKGASQPNSTDKKGKGKEKKAKKQKEKKKSKPMKPADETLSSGAKERENAYENPNCSTSEEKPNRTKNEDGLIYIDVEIPKQNGTKNQKSVIHGLEDRTIYADVAYGQVGEQLPENDEEEKPKDA